MTPGERPPAAVEPSVGPGTKLLTDELVRRLHPRFVNFAQRRVGSRVAAEDRVQDMWCAAVRHSAQFDTKRGSLEGWLYTILANGIRETHRRSTLRRSCLGEPRPPEPVPSCEAQLEARAVLRALAKVDLPPLQAAALSLCSIEGVPACDAAAQLKTSRGAIRVRVHRARTTLRAVAGRAETPSLRTIRQPSERRESLG